jgi:hypothetical protein
MLSLSKDEDRAIPDDRAIPALRQAQDEENEVSEKSSMRC